jgi:catechol 2,3-dioxygenase-like lactoylglutathione lyase family enzyme
MTLQPSPVFELRVVITADDYDAAIRFWRDALGLPTVREFPGGSLLAAGEATIEILSKEAAAGVDRIETGRSESGTVLRLALEVADAGDLAEDLEAAGAERLGGPVDTPWGHRNLRLKTADGVTLTLFTVTAGDQAG